MKNPARTFLAAAVLALASIALASPGMADRTRARLADTDPRLDQAKALQESQAAIGRQIGDHELVDTRGRTVRLSEFLGRPLVLNFIYTGCAQSCNVMTRVLADVYDNAREVLGRDSFAAVTIGFDTINDTPERMLAFARQRDVANMPGWRFLSGSAETVEALARTAGFQYFPSTKGFDHLDQVTIINAEGKVHAQIYGEVFDKPLLMEPLKQLVFGTPAPYRSVGDLIKKIRLFCTLYDPKADRYQFDYSLFMGIGAGVLVIGGVIIALARELLSARRRRRHQDRAV
jgi:protein SCO1/2